MNDARKDTPEPFVKVDGAAHHLSLQKSTVYQRVSKNLIPYHKLGTSPKAPVRFRLSELDLHTAGLMPGGLVQVHDPDDTESQDTLTPVTPASHNS